MPPSYLTQSQRETLAQFESITARNDPDQEEASLEALEESGWNLEAAISRIYDGTTSSRSNRNSYPPSRDDSATVDEALLPSSSSSSPSPSSTRRSTSRTNGVNRTNGMGTGVIGLYYLRQALAVPIQILSYPLSIIYNLSTLVLGFLARLLGFRLSTSTFHPRNPFTSPRRPRTILSPYAASSKWVESLSSSSSAPLTSTTGIEIGSSSGLSRRGASAVEGTEGLLRDLCFIGGYEEALRKARDDFRVLMVVLTCEENELHAEFKRDVLHDAELLKSLKDEKVMLWGGDVMERDAYQVGRTLSYTSLPFIAFISLQPVSSTPQSSSSSSSSPRLSLITRLEPSSTLPSLSASHIHTHLHSQVLPKTTQYLSRLSNDKTRRENERKGREDRERRESEVARRDEERIIRLRKEIELKRREQALAVERREREREELERRQERARLARKWREIKRAELARRREEGDVRVVVRLGNGKRVIRRFGKEEPVKEVYEWVECELGLEEDQQSNEEQRVGDLSEYEQKFAFRLATTFPRHLIELPQACFEASSSSNSRSSFDSLEGGGNARIQSVGEAFEGMGKDISLVVDGLEERRRLSMSSRGDEDEEDEDEEWEEEE